MHVELAPRPQLARPAPVQVRLASVRDCEAVASIYNEGIEERQATFETGFRSPADICEWLAGAAELPLFVAVDEDGVCGWGRLTRYSERPAYAGVNEVSVYVARAARGRGVATALLTRLAEEAERRGRWKLVSKVFATNTASLALLASCGWREVGIHERHARRDGEWRDVVAVERTLGRAE